MAPCMPLNADTSSLVQTALFSPQITLSVLKRVNFGWRGPWNRSRLLICLKMKRIKFWEATYRGLLNDVQPVRSRDKSPDCGPKDTVKTREGFMKSIGVVVSAFLLLAFTTLGSAEVKQKN